MSGKEVMEPWPISAPALRIVILPSGAMRTQGVMEALASAASAGDTRTRRTPTSPSARQNVIPLRPASTLRRDRLLSIMVMASALLRHTLDGRNDAVVGSAAADIAIHMRDDIRTAGLGIFCKQLRSFHDLTGLAVAALGHFFGYPGFLQRVRRVRRETFDRDDLLTRNRTKFGLARALRRAVDVHG